MVEAALAACLVAEDQVEEADFLVTYSAAFLILSAWGKCSVSPAENKAHRLRRVLLALLRRLEFSSTVGLLPQA